MEHRFEVPADFQEVTAEDLQAMEVKGTGNGIILPKDARIEVGQLVKRSFEAKEVDKNTGEEKTVLKDAFYFVCQITIDGKSTIVPVSYRTFNPFPKERKKFLLQTKFGMEVHNALNDRARAEFIAGKNLTVKELQDCEYKPHGSTEYKRKPFMVLEME